MKGSWRGVRSGACGAYSIFEQQWDAICVLARLFLPSASFVCLCGCLSAEGPAGAID